MYTINCNFTYNPNLLTIFYLNNIIDLIQASEKDLTNSFSLLTSIIYASEITILTYTNT